MNGTYLKKHNEENNNPQIAGIRVRKTNGAFLLDEGDELRISESVTLIYRSHIAARLTSMTPVQKQEKRVRGYGKVVIAIHQKRQRQVACKIIDLSTYSAVSPYPISNAKGSRRWPTRVAKCFREFDILKELNHPNVIALEKVFWSINSIYIFQELVTGGDLFSYLEFKGGRLSDVESAVVIRQILKGIEYLHSQDIVHRDLKPDNVLMTSLDDGARVVITDFGNARFLPKSNSAPGIGIFQRQRMFSLAGTLEFAAPEIHKLNPSVPTGQGYSKSVDMWSIGCLTALLLSGDAIFTNRSDPRYEYDPATVILGLAAKCDLSVLDSGHEAWSCVSDAPKDFIRKLLRLQDEDRMTAPEALAHPWFTNKVYAAEFEALYERSVRNWQPRPRVFRLVESISSVSAELAMLDVPEDILSQETVSKYFVPPNRARSPYDIHASLSVPPHPPPLPSITEDLTGLYEETSSQLPPPPVIVKGLSACSRFANGTLNDSMEKLSVDPIHEDFHDGRNEYTVDTSIFQRQCTPEAQPRSDNSIVRETPYQGTKRHFRSGSYVQEGEHNSDECVSLKAGADLNSTQYFVRELSKRRKHVHGFD